MFKPDPHLFLSVRRSRRCDKTRRTPTDRSGKRKSGADFYRHMSRVHVTAHVIAGINESRAASHNHSLFDWSRTLTYIRESPKIITKLTPTADTLQLQVCDLCFFVSLLWTSQQRPQLWTLSAVTECLHGELAVKLAKYVTDKLKRCRKQHAKWTFSVNIFENSIHLIQREV